MFALPLLALTGCSSVLVDFGKSNLDDTAIDSASDSDTSPDSDTAPDSDSDTNPELTPSLDLSASSVDLGFAAPDAPLSASLVATNIGTAPLDLSGLIGDGATHFTVDFTSTQLDPGVSITLVVGFSGSDTGTYGGSLDLTSNDPDVPTISIPLTATVANDADGDGYAPGADCDDTDPSVNPGATDTPYDGEDTDCSGGSDYDADGDGHDSATESPDGSGDDCDDSDPAINPSAIETWYDGIDEDCSEGSDYDQDGDGHDSATESPDGSGDDCDDDNPDVYPGRLEDEGNGIDDDCDGDIDETLADLDTDGDGFSETDGDCDDADDTIHPAATDTWYDGIDSDCAGDDDYDQDADGYRTDDYGGDDCDDTAAAIHPGAPDAPYDGVDKDCSGGSDYDADGDGYDSSVHGGDDCNDTDATIHPGATEIWYDGVNQDCATGSDYDQDGDGRTTTASGGTDCDDLDPTVYDGAPETWYDGVDQDCDGASDFDQDGDGYDSDAWGGTDCDDTAWAVHPGAVEVWYDGVDADCSGGSDYDRDGDGYDSSVHGGTDCNDNAATVYPGAPETWYDGVDADCSGGSDYDQDGDGYVQGVLDCDDTEASIYKAATETCDGVDNDCDGLTDETASTWYQDADSDTYGNAAVSTTDCTQPAGYVADNTDCDDTQSSVHPGAAEVSYDTLDNDCDGYTDEMNAVDESDWTIIGTTTSEAVGASSATLLDDEDGDGYDELVVSAPSNDSGGTDAGALAWHDLPLRGKNVAFTSGYLLIVGDNSGDAFGYGTQALGDVDGWDDGESEFAAGAPGNDDSAPDAGAVYILDIYSSEWKTGTWLVDDLSGAKLTGSAANVRFGSALTSGDFDADGEVDLAVGAWGASSSRGAAYLYDADDEYYGNDYNDTDATWLLRGVASGDQFGYVLARGDIDGDGDDDVTVCAPGFDVGSSTSGAGGCWVVDIDSMPTYTSTNVSSVDTAQIAGGASSDGVGSTTSSVSMADIDGDGTADLALGAPGYDGSETDGGLVAIYLSKTLTGNLTLASADTLITGDGALGTSVILGDINGSGDIGLVAGSPTAGSAEQGVVYALSTKHLQSGGTVALPDSAYGSWTGQTGSDAFGTTLSGVFDIDGDGTDDFVGGTPGWDNGATSAVGKDYVLPLW